MFGVILGRGLRGLSILLQPAVIEIVGFAAMRSAATAGSRVGEERPWRREKKRQKKRRTAERNHKGERL